MGVGRIRRDPPVDIEVEPDPVFVSSSQADHAVVMTTEQHLAMLELHVAGGAYHLPNVRLLDHHQAYCADLVAMLRSYQRSVSNAAVFDYLQGLIDLGEAGVRTGKISVYAAEHFSMSCAVIIACLPRNDQGVPSRFVELYGPLIANPTTSGNLRSLRSWLLSEMKRLEEL